MPPSPPISRHPYQRAMTLLELLIVLAVIGGLLFFYAVFFGISIDPPNSKVGVARVFVHIGVKIPLEAYRQDMGDYPSTAEGLQALHTPVPGKQANWRGSYLESSDGKQLLDPWKHPYQYAYPPIHNTANAATGTAARPDVWSMGPDGVSGTADDIGNW